MSAAGELRALSRHRAARRRGHHQRGARAPRVLRLGGRDRRGQGRDPRGPRPGRRRRPERRRPARARASASAAPGAVVWFGRDRRYDVSAENWRGTAHGMRFDLRLGGHDLDVALPLRRPALRDELPGRGRRGPPLGHRPPTRSPKRPPALTAGAAPRRRCRGCAQGVTLLDDCYNSNPVAVEAAVTRSRPGGAAAAGWPFLGDMLELGPAGRRAPPRGGPDACAAALDVLVAVGPLAALFLEGAREAGMPPAQLVAFDGRRRPPPPRADAGPRRATRCWSRARAASRMERWWTRCARFGPGGGADLMLYHLLYALRHEFSALNVVRYITFRTAVASLTALFLVLVLGPWMIERLRRLQIGQYIREEGPQAPPGEGGHAHHGRPPDPDRHPACPTLLWADLTNRNVWILVLADPRLRRHRLRRRLPEGREEAEPGPAAAGRKIAGQIAVALVIGAAPCTWSRCVEPDPVLDPRLRPLLQERRCPTWACSTSSSRWSCWWARRQRREPHRRPRRPRHRLAPSSPPPPSPSSPTSAATASSPTTSTSCTCRGRARSPSSAGRWSAPPWASCGGTAIPAQVFMGDVGSLRWAAPSARWRSSSSRSCCWSSWAAVRDGGPLGDPAGGVLQAARQAHLPHGAAAPPLRADRAGRSRRSSSASGSWPSSSRCSRSRR